MSDRDKQMIADLADRLQSTNDPREAVRLSIEIRKLAEEGRPSSRERQEQNAPAGTARTAGA